MFKKASMAMTITASHVFSTGTVLGCRQTADIGHDISIQARS
jgi:hypothetical protein